MNSTGLIMPRSGWIHRTRTSAPVPRPFWAHLGLVEDPQLVLLQRAAELALDAQPLQRRGVEFLRVELIALAALLVGVARSDAGVAGERVRLHAVVGEDGDADAGRD
jgi:hypothetical protein